LKITSLQITLDGTKEKNQKRLADINIIRIFAATVPAKPLYNAQI
jgi:hypothetical protein